MDSLRLTLILIGLVILALIWMLHKPDGSTRKPGATRREAGHREAPPSDDDSESTADPRDGEPPASSGEPRQARLPDMGSEAPDWSVESPRRTDARRARRAPEPETDPRLDALTEDEAPRSRRTRAPGPEPDRAAEDRERPKPSARREPPRREPRIEPETPSRTEAGTADRIEPTWPGDEPEESPSEAAPRERGGSDANQGSARIVTLYLRARGERLISGLSLLDSAIKAGLRFGEMKIFHRRHQGASKPVFSMANIARPGSFDPSGWNLFETQGVTLFMTLPGPVSGLDAWDAMLATGQRLSELLDADLMDDSQCLLTRQRIAQIREDMREYDRKAGLGT